MKRFLRVLAGALVGVAAMGVAACNNGGGSNSKTMVVTPELITFDVDGNAVGNNTVTVIGADWSASVGSGQDWIHISDDAGTDGGMFTVTVAGEAKAARQGTITVTNILNTTIQKYITVKQSGPVIVQDPDAEIIRNASGRYWGDYYGIGVSNFDIDLYTTELDESGYPIGDGYNIIIEFFSEDISDVLNPDIASGTYTVNDSMEIYTAIPGYFEEYYMEWVPSLAITIANGEFTEILTIAEGTFMVDNQGGGKYVMAFDFKLSDGSTLKAYYNGCFELENMILMSTLDGDVEFPTMTKGLAEFWDDYYETGTYSFSISLHSAGYDLDEGTGTGIYCFLELFAAQEGDGTSIPDGTYIFNDSQQAYSIAPGELVMGIFPNNSWYFDIVDGVHINRAPFCSGQTLFAKTGNTYKIDFDAFDDIGFNITGNFEGELVFDDRTMDAAAYQSLNTKALAVVKSDEADHATLQRAKYGKLRDVK